MNKKLLLTTILFLLSLTASLAFSTNNSSPILSDSTDCVLFYELTQEENGDFMVSLLPDTTWTFPFNIVSTAQITIKVPTGGFEVGEITDLITGVSFFKTGRDNSPIEEPTFDYISFSLGSQGTSRITFQKGEKIGLFSFTNIGICPDGSISLMDNLTDPFFPPNSKQSNAGLQMTVSGFGGPDLPVGIAGASISCNPMAEIPPVDTMVVVPPVDTIVTVPMDTVVTTPIDTTSTVPIDTVVTTPVDMEPTSPVSTSVIDYELELDAAGNYVVSLIPDTTWNFPFNIVGTAQITIKIPTGGFIVGDITDLIDGVSFFNTGRDNSPEEEPTFDYLSFSLGSQGTSRIPFQKGQKVGLFSFTNIGICPNGNISLMDNMNDPFSSPNSKQSNPGQQMTVSGFGGPDLPIGIIGSSNIACNSMEEIPPVDTMVVVPIDTMTTVPIDTMVTTPVSTSAISYELELDTDGNYIISLISDTTWNFPLNIVGTAQITVKVPTGGFLAGDITDLIDGVSFAKTGRDNSPEEDLTADYLSFGLRSQGTSRIAFQKGEKVSLFSFQNVGTCPGGTLSLMNNLTDPFFPPNSKRTNPGQQMTVTGFGAADLPIGILGSSIIICQAPVIPMDTMEVTPVDTMPTVPMDTMVTTPIDTIESTGPVSTNILFYELELDADGNYIVSLIPDTTWVFPFNIVGTAQVTIKVPTGGFIVGDITNLIDGVSFAKGSRDNSPTEDPNFDYLSFGLSSQGTTRIPFQKGQKVNLFSFKNTGICPGGTLSLMDNLTDPFSPPNSKQTNPGQQMTVSGFGAADLPIGILGTSIIACQTPTVPVDTMEVVPVDTMEVTPVDTMVVQPVDTTSTPPLTDSGLTVQLAVQNISCKGANDGIIVLKPANGQPPYSYQWTHGPTTSSIENLPPGTYVVIVTDKTGFFVERTIIITESDVLNVVISKANVSQVGANDGQGRAIVTGGAAPYTYVWSNGSIQPQINNLPEGTYALTVTDAFGCTTQKGITIIDQSKCTAVDVALNLQSPTCSGDNDGQIVVTPQGGQAPFDYAWEIGGGTNTISGIPAGVYMVTVTDGTGCTMAVSAMLQDPSPISIQLTANTETATISSNVSGGIRPYTYAWSNGATSSSISNLTDGVYMLTLTDNQGCETVLSEVISSNSCALNILTELGNPLTLDPVGCDEKGSFCLPVPKDSMINYSIFLDGEDYSSNLKGCQFETFFAYSYAFFPGRTTTGNYEVREWMVNGNRQSGNFTTIDDLVTSMNIWDPTGNWVNLSELAIIQGGDPNNTYGSMQLMTGGASTILEANTNLTPKRTEVTFKPGEHTLILVHNESTCSDTLSIILPCSGASRDSIINITIQEGGQVPLCLEPLFGTGFQISSNTCPDLSGTATAIVFNEITKCLDIVGLMIGTEEACYTITDATGETINLNVVINVQPPSSSCLTIDTDTIYTFAPSCAPIQACLQIPFVELSAAILTIDNQPYTGAITACSSGGTAITFNKVGTQNLRFTYGMNCVLDVVAVVGCDENIVIEETIDIGTIDVICPMLSSLQSTFVSVENICPTASGDHVVFDLLDDSGCISFNAVSIGSDTACIKICDAIGFCDTVTLIYHVEDQTGAPPIFFEAVDDSITIRLNESVVLDVLSNDSFRFLDTTYVTREPANGQAIINPDGTFTYIAQTGFCDEDRPVTFEYAICESSICDTATVSIYIDCFVSNLIIYNGFSPNDDGINDSFRIDGIENYPGNTVRIFNRWGNRVFSQEGYKNEWSGNWNGRTVLPDGTYFYMIDLGDGSAPLKGHLQIRR